MSPTPAHKPFQLASAVLVIALFGCQAGLIDDTPGADASSPPDAAIVPGQDGAIAVPLDGAVADQMLAPDACDEGQPGCTPAADGSTPPTYDPFAHVPVLPGQMNFAWYPAAKRRYATTQPDDPLDWPQAYKDASDTTTVSSCDELQAALDQVAPGEMIIVQTGEYQGCKIKITRGGTAQAPIVLTAEAKALGGSGKVVFRGADIFATLTPSAKHYVIGGFEFRGQTMASFNFSDGVVSEDVYGEGATDIRLTDNLFEGVGQKAGSHNGVIRVGQRCHRVRVDHNAFINNYNHVRYKHGKDSLVSATKDGRIDHNYFGPPPSTGFLDGVGYEIAALQTCCWHIRETSDPLTLTVEYNVIEMPGSKNTDPELMEIKTNGAVIRNNIAWRDRSGAGISLRYSYHSKVQSNYLVNVGIGLHGSFHTISDNYIDGAGTLKTGIAMGRWGRRQPPNCTDMPPTHDNQILRNTIIDTAQYGMRIGDCDYGACRPIKDSQIDDNTVRSSTGKLLHFNTVDEPGRTTICDASNTSSAHLQDDPGDADGGLNEGIEFSRNTFAKSGTASFGSAYALDADAVTE